MSSKFIGVRAFLDLVPSVSAIVLEPTELTLLSLELLYLYKVTPESQELLVTSISVFNFLITYFLEFGITVDIVILPF